MIVGLVSSFMCISFVLIIFAAYPASSATHESGFFGFLARDPASSGSYYFSFYGALLVIVYFAVASAFVSTLLVTIKQTEELRQVNQRAFMMELGAFFTVYLATVPATVLFSGLIDPWAREFWIRTLDMTAQFIGPSVMVFLIWPSRAEKHFLLAGSFRKVAGGNFDSIFSGFDQDGRQASLLGSEAGGPAASGDDPYGNF